MIPLTWTWREEGEPICRRKLAAFRQRGKLESGGWNLISRGVGGYWWLVMSGDLRTTALHSTDLKTLWGHQYSEFSPWRSLARPSQQSTSLATWLQFFSAFTLVLSKKNADHDILGWDQGHLLGRWRIFSSFCKSWGAVAVSHWKINE